MRIEVHAPRCPDCDEEMTWVRRDRQVLTICRWCKAYGKPEVS